MYIYCLWNYWPFNNPVAEVKKKTVNGTQPFIKAAPRGAAIGRVQLHNISVLERPLAAGIQDGRRQPISARLCLALARAGKAAGPSTRRSVKFCG